VKLKFPIYCVRKFIMNFSDDYLQDDNAYKSVVSRFELVMFIYRCFAF
jgi:uncharacterized protein YbgA (DUF1722 family)